MRIFADGGYKQGMLILLLGFWVTVALAVTAPGEVRAQKTVQAERRAKMDNTQPIQIVSDRLDAYQEKRNVIFSGNAVATQGDKTIKADQLILHYKDSSDKPQKPQKKEIKGMGETGDLEYVEAVGHVIITQPGRIVTGDHAIFYQDTQKVIMTGSAVMRDGKNTIKGHRVTVYLDEDRGVVESDVSKRVTATIYPNEKKEEKK